MNNQGTSHSPRTKGSPIFIEGLTKIFPLANDAHGRTVLRQLTLKIEAGELCTIFGPNACGKTTLIRCIAGLQPFESGVIRIGDHEPGEGDIGYVFQNFTDSLFPWRTVQGNILFPLEWRITNATERRSRLESLIKELDIDIALDARVYELSVGQKQIVCLLRAFIVEPEILLLDEPFNSLDYETRMRMHEVLQRLWLSRRTTILFISHDPDEAIFLGQRVILMNKSEEGIRKAFLCPFDYPRNRAILGSDEFIKLRCNILSIFENEGD